MEPVEYKVGSKRNPVIIALKEWNGRKLLDVRKFFVDKKDESKYLPTKKGISLNEMQLQQLIEVFNDKKVEITDFFESSVEEQSEIKLKLTSTIGRKFRFDFSNKHTEFVLDEGLANKLGNGNTELVKRLLYCFQSALLDVLEEDDEIEQILDSLSHKMVKTKWQ
jgi:hypothetical protein